MNNIPYYSKIWIYLAGVVLIVAICFGLYGVFNEVGGSWINPPPESNYFVNNFITQITDEGVYYQARWSRYTIQCSDEDELIFLCEREFWDNELEEWESLGSTSVGTYPCEQQNGGSWYYKYNDPDVVWYISKENLTTYGAGYYRLKMWAGDDGYGENDPYALVYWDEVDLVLSGDYTPTPKVWGIDPVSGTEITNLDTLLRIGYEDLNTYDSLYIALRHPPTGLFTEAKRYDIINIGGSGELEIPLTHFNIEKNGNWYLHAIATYEGYQYEDDLFLSDYGWNWTSDLTEGNYYLDINIEGFEEIFFMSNFETWYSENAKFDTPTEMFYDIASVFSPIFSTIGEFGNRIINYFDINSAYSKGYDIGRSIPFFRYYVGQITHFLGGFPIIAWLLIIILILVGIFIFRIIMKFIPFLG